MSLVPRFYRTGSPRAVAKKSLGADEAGSIPERSELSSVFPLTHPSSPKSFWLFPKKMLPQELLVEERAVVCPQPMTKIFFFQKK